MELRQYWHIVYRRLWIVILLPLIVVVASFAFRPPPTTGAMAHLRLTVGIAPEKSNGTFYTYDRYYSWLTAEYLADDLSEIIKSRAFAEAVSKRLGSDLAPVTIQGATTPQKLHRILTVTVSAPSAQQALEIAGAIEATLRESVGQFLPQLSAENAVITVIDPPTLVPIGPGLRERLDLPLRLILALGAALGLVFLLDYLDETVRNAEDLEKMGLVVLAEIPRRRLFLIL